MLGRRRVRSCAAGEGEAVDERPCAREEGVFGGGGRREGWGLWGLGEGKVVGGGGVRWGEEIVVPENGLVAAEKGRTWHGMGRGRG